jgi:aminodeoxyfutalosine deaminase
MIKKIAAHFLFTGNGKPIKNGVLTIDQNGKILEISQPAFDVQEIAGLEFHAGILIPGFVNAHCHLELSHMKSLIPEKTGLHGFVSKISNGRKADDDKIVKAARQEDIRMWYNGINAVGDVSNLDHTFGIKQQSKIAYHTFLEVFSTFSGLAEFKFEQAIRLQKMLVSNGLPSSVVPHAPYSVSPALFALIKAHSARNNQFVSMHNQETESENDMFLTKSGKLIETMEALGVNFDSMLQTGKTALESVLPMLERNQKCLLVHNTFTNKEDIERASDYFRELYWIVCPNANLYIEGILPKIDLFRKMQQKIAIGTDSLASNHQLSVLEEMKTISFHFPDIELWELVQWACKNGAEALGFTDTLGSFEPGKTPGVNLVSKLDLNRLKLLKESTIKRMA